MNIEKEKFFNEMQTWISDHCECDGEIFTKTTNLLETGILDSLKLILFYSKAESLLGKVMDAQKITMLKDISIEALYNVLTSEK